VISLKLEPARHPIPNDKMLDIVRRGAADALRRPDAAPAVRALHALWFVAMGLLPRRVARRLAIRFLFPPGRSTLLRAALAPFLGR
jgi:hypothetical protein